MHVAIHSVIVRVGTLTLCSGTFNQIVRVRINSDFKVMKHKFGYMVCRMGNSDVHFV